MNFLPFDEFLLYDNLVLIIGHHSAIVFHDVEAFSFTRADQESQSCYTVL